MRTCCVVSAPQRAPVAAPAGTLSGRRAANARPSPVRCMAQAQTAVCSTNHRSAWCRSMVAQIFQIIADINKEGVAVLLVEQNANQALATAQRGYVLETGKIVLAGEADMLLHDPGVRAAYLGGYLGRVGCVRGLRELAPRDCSRPVRVPLCRRGQRTPALSQSKRRVRGRDASRP